MAPELIQQFEAETGIKVNYDTFDSSEMLETKLLTGNTRYDVVVPSAPCLQRQATAGVYQPIDRARLPHYGSLDPEMMAMLAVNDPGNTYGIGYMWGTIGIAVVDAPSEIIAATLMSLGKDANSDDPADLAAAEARLMGIRPYVRYINSESVLGDLADGQICVAVSWNGIASRARLRAQEANRDSDIRYTIPVEGTLSFGDVMAIPKDAPHPDTAHAFIDFLLRPEVGARLAEFVRYATHNRAALPLLDDEITSDESIYPPPEVRARLQLAQARSHEQTRVENRIWTRFRTGQ